MKGTVHIYIILKGMAQGDKWRVDNYKIHCTVRYIVSTYKHMEVHILT